MIKKLNKRPIVLDEIQVKALGKLKMMIKSACICYGCHSEIKYIEKLLKLLTPLEDFKPILGDK